MLKLLESENIVFSCPYCFFNRAKLEIFEHHHITDVLIRQITCHGCKCTIDKVFSPHAFNVEKGKLYEKSNFNDAPIVSASLS